MRTLLIAAGVGAVVGVVGRRRARHAAEPRVRLWPLLVGGLALQLVAGRADGAGGLTALLASYALLVAFAVANLSTVGMWLVALGVALNLAVIAANDGMPVRHSALVRAGLEAPEAVITVWEAGKRHLETPRDRLTVLADIVPVRPLREVLSFGDLVLAMGVADVLAHLMRRRAPAGT